LQNASSLVELSLEKFPSYNIFLFVSKIFI